MEDSGIESRWKTHCPIRAALLTNILHPLTQSASSSDQGEQSGGGSTPTRLPTYERISPLLQCCVLYFGCRRVGTARGGETRRSARLSRKGKARIAPGSSKMSVWLLTSPDSAEDVAVMKFHRQYRKSCRTKGQLKPLLQFRRLSARLCTLPLSAVSIPPHRTAAPDTSPRVASRSSARLREP